MNIRSLRTFLQGTKMSSVLIAQNLERRERARGLTLPDARMRLADKLRIGVGTFENIVRNRVKRVDENIRDRLQALLVRELETEIARLSHELEIARQGGSHIAIEQVGEIETHLTAARSLLNGEDAR
jgi:hypothetical protein